MPAFPDRDAVLINARLDDRGYVADAFSRGFFLRTPALDPEDLALLNPQADTIEGSQQSFAERGYFAYGQVAPEDVLGALRASRGAWLERGAGGG